MTHGEKAKEYFRSGYNCAQATLLAFSDVTGLDEATAIRLSSSFGGGMGRMREVCGAVSAIFMAAGLLYAPDHLTGNDEKIAHYARIQELAARFKAQTGTILCRGLLEGVTKDDSPNAEPRTEAYYQKRPCADLCALAADILEAYLQEHPPMK